MPDSVRAGAGEAETFGVHSGCPTPDYRLSIPGVPRAVAVLRRHHHEVRIHIVGKNGHLVMMNFRIEGRTR